MSGCADNREGAPPAAHVGVDATAAHGNTDVLPESFVSTAQWVARHADIKQRFEKIRSEFEQRCSACLGADSGLKPSGDKSPRASGVSRRPSESACKHQSHFYADGSSNYPGEADLQPTQTGYGTYPHRSSVRSATVEDYLDWMYTQKPPGSSGRSRPAGVPLRSSVQDRRSDADSGDPRRPPLGGGSGRSRSEAPDSGGVGGRTRDSSPSCAAELAKERKSSSGGGCVFTFDAQPDDADREETLPRSASFTMDCHAASAAAAGDHPAMHRSPSQPAAQRPDTPASCDSLKMLPGVQVSRVKKVSSLRSFGSALEDRSGQSVSTDSLPQGGDAAAAAPRPATAATPTYSERLSECAAAAGSAPCGPALVRSPRVQRRPAVPPTLQSLSPQQQIQQQQRGGLASPDCPHSALSPGKLRPAVLHPELKNILSQLDTSPELALSRDMADCRPAAANRPATPTADDDNAVDEGLDMSASFGGGSAATGSATGQYLLLSADFLQPAAASAAAIEDGGISTKKKAGKRNHTHPPSTRAADCPYGADVKAKDTNGFSHMCEHQSDSGGGCCGRQGLSEVEGQHAQPDSLYNSLDDVVDTSGSLGHGPAAASVALADSHMLASAAAAGLSGGSAQAVCATGSSSGKFKRVKSDPFPDSRSLAGVTGDASGDAGIGTAAASCLERSPSDATHERSRSACSGQQSSSDGPLDAAAAATTAAVSSGNLVSSDGSSNSVVSAGKGAHEQRMHIVNEIIEKEEIYVANLEQVSQAVSQLKEQEILDSSTVDKIFCSIRLPESRVHHKIFLESMRLVQRQWEPHATTVGDRIANMFSSQSVLENYMAYVSNCSKSKARLEQAFKTKPNFCKFNDAFRRGNVSRQDLRAVLSLPANHLISYRFFIERMLKYTPDVHPDNERLLRARSVVLELLDKVGGQDGTDGAEAERTLKKLETLLSVQDLALQPDRVYLRNDCVMLKPGKRECYYLWLFSDILLISMIKGSRINSMSGKLSHPRRSSMTVLSPRGQEVIEKVPHKLWMRLGLEEVDVMTSPESEKRKCIKDMADAESDLERLMRISDEADALVMQHERLQKNVLELMDVCNQRLVTLRQRRDAVDMLSLQLLIGGGASSSGDGSMELTLTFDSAEKRSSWEAMLSEAKVNLEAALTDKMPPEFKEAIPITKTRSGMQFSCAAAVEGLAVRDVWICNSDSYVGHVCLLNLLPQPTVSMSTAVPSCTSRVLCICAVPAGSATAAAAAAALDLDSRLSRSLTSSRSGGSSCSSRGAAVAMSCGSSTETLLDLHAPDAIDECSESGSSNNGDDRGNRSNGEDDFPTDDDIGSAVEDLCIHETADLSKSLMWLGTEDGCIHIFNSEENLRTSRVRPVRIQHRAGVLCIVFLEQSVFVSLSNGTIVVYRRSDGGGWNLEGTAEALAGNGSSSTSMTLPAPVTKMLAVCGKLWCSYQNEIVVLDPTSLKAEISFAASTDRLRTVQSMVYSRHGIVAVAIQGSCEVRLFHASTRKHLGDISIAAAVAQKLQGCDDIIRQHKAACLKITALLTCKDSLWVGTSAGVILTMPLPKITSSMANSREYSITAPPITGLSVGHTGNVRFLLCADVPRLPAASDAAAQLHLQSDAGASLDLPSAARASSSGPAAGPSVVAKMLVISGGDGYEVFAGGHQLPTPDGLSGGSVGSSDSVNHLLVWEM